jgi:hypothetical protein
MKTARVDLIEDSVFVPILIVAEIQA